MPRFRTASAILVVGLSLVMRLEAQSRSGTLRGRALVRQPIGLTGARNLDFGIVIQAIIKTIAAGASNLTIGTWTGCFNRAAANAAAGRTAFTPSAAARNTTFGAAGALFVFVGARVTPTAAQAPGVYVAPVAMTLTYF